jgi:hypothetical protein
MEWTEGPDGSFRNEVTGETRWERPASMASRRDGALLREPQGAAAARVVREELEDLTTGGSGATLADGDAEPAAAAPPVPTGPTFELKFSMFVAMDLTVGTAPLFVRLSVGDQLVEGAPREAEGADCMWEDETLSLTLDEQTWLGQEAPSEHLSVAAAARQAAHRPASGAHDALRVAVWALKPAPHKPSLLGEAVVPTQSLHQARNAADETTGETPCFGGCYSPSCGE